MTAILTEVRQDLTCSFDLPFPDEPKEVGFSVIYWPAVLDLKSAFSVRLPICVLLGV